MKSISFVKDFLAELIRQILQKMRIAKVMITCFIAGCNITSITAITKMGLLL